MHPNVPQARRVKFKAVVHNQAGPAVAGHEVIDTPEEYKEWIAACTGDKGAFPENIDFEKEMLIAVAAGQRPTGGYDIRITAIAEIVGGVVGVQWEVLYSLNSPGGPAPDVLTYPQHVVRARRFEGIITFRPLEAPVYTTLALGEEGPPPQPPPPPRATTLAVGEEGPTATTLAVGEEGPTATTLAVGEEGPTATTLAVGEEGPPATTKMIGEEMPTTNAVGEEVMTTMAVGEEGPGGGGPFGAF
jgi:hypothetical protein